MKYRNFFIVLLIFAFIASPVSAFTANNLNIVIDTNGNAAVTFDYALSWPEKVLYFVIPGKEQIVTAALGSKYPRLTVTDVTVGPDRSRLTLGHFASVSRSATEITYRTPAVSFAVAGDLLADYPEIARFVMPDFSPDVTIVAFPDGKEFTYYNEDALPVITYSVAA